MGSYFPACMNQASSCSIIPIHDLTQIVIWLLMFFTGFVIDGSIVLINLAAMETVPDSLSGSALGLATFSSQLRKTKFTINCVIIGDI